VSDSKSAEGNRLFGPKKEGIEEWRKLHNEDLYNLHSSSNRPSAGAINLRMRFERRVVYIMSVFENRVVRIFRQKRDEIRVGW
jgi:hypothetical protein